MMKKVSVEAIRTDVLRAADDLHHFLKKHLAGKVDDGCVVAITSKIVSIAEGRVVPKSQHEKRDLVLREADVYLGEGGYGIELTVKHGLLIPSAGIDESNSEGENFILYPTDPYASAARIGKFLRSEFGLRNLGVILTDSHTMLLRRGVTGISLAHWGVKATRSLVGHPDVFGKELKFTSVDVVDSLAAMAVFVMGEANEQCPLAVVSGAKLEFTDSSSCEEIAIPLKDDLYFPILEPALGEG